jgi:DNA-binding beta-propeller fold protein YncE
MRNVDRILIAAVVAAGCRQVDGREVKSGDEERVQPAGTTHVASIAGFRSPESVKYDPDQDAWFVTNIIGFGSDKDGQAYIVRIEAGNPDSMTVFAKSGVNGVTLDAPKGMAIQGDTLWVADIDVLRGFDRRTGAPVGTVDLGAYGVTMLNDVALGPDGTLRVTDTGILMTEKGVLRPGGDRIFGVGPGRAVSVIAEGSQLGEPNGITWDATAKRWVVVGFKRFNARVDAYAPDFGKVTQLSSSGGESNAGEFDGVEVLPSGAIIYACWTDSSIHAVHDGKDTRVVRFVPEPADIGYDTKRGVIAVPLVMMDQVQFFTLRGSLIGAAAPRRE